MVIRLKAIEEHTNVLPLAYGRPYFVRRGAFKGPTWDNLFRRSAEIDPERPIIWLDEHGRICLPNLGKQHEKLHWKGEREGPEFPHTGRSGADNVLARARTEQTRQNRPDRTEQPPISPQGGKRTSGGGCTGEGENSTPREKSVEELIPGLPAYRIAAQGSGVPIGTIAELLLETEKPVRLLAALLITSRDAKAMAKAGKKIQNPGGYLRTVLFGTIPDADYDSAKGLLKGYGVKRDELEPKDAEAIGAILERAKQ